MEQHETLSFCGVYCGGCRNYKENADCSGCRNEENLLDDCPTRSCAIKRGVLHCGECEEFPCAELRDFYGDGKRHHEVAFENIRQIRKNGTTKWLVEQENEHTCKCGGRILWFATKCTKCIQDASK